MSLRHDPSLVDETDLALVHALQTAPRAPWAAVGRALGIDPSTAARRWARLAEAGLAWVTCYPADRRLEDMGSALIEVACAPEATGTAGRQFAGAPHVVSVEHVSGSHALLLTVLVPTLSDLSGYLLGGLAGVTGVTGTRTYLATRLFSEASHWQLDALSAAQQQVLQPYRPAPGPPGRAARPLTEVDTELAVLLSQDGRMPVADLAVRLGVSESTVTRRLRSLLADGRLVLRAEIAQPWSGAPVGLNLWARIPPDRLEQAGSALCALPGVRLCAALTGGSANLRLSRAVRSRSPPGWSPRRTAATRAVAARRRPLPGTAPPQADGTPPRTGRAQRRHGAAAGVVTGVGGGRRLAPTSPGHGPPGLERSRLTEGTAG